MRVCGDVRHPPAPGGHRGRGSAAPRDHHHGGARAAGRPAGVRGNRRRAAGATRSRLRAGHAQVGPAGGASGGTFPGGALRLPRLRGLRAVDPAHGYTHAGHLLALLDHLSIGQAALAGLSFGGRVVMQAALAAPARVRGLALLDAVLGGVAWDPVSAEALDEASRQAGARGAGRAGRLAGAPAVRRRPPAASGGQRAVGHGRRVPGAALDQP